MTTADEQNLVAHVRRLASDGAILYVHIARRDVVRLDLKHGQRVEMDMGGKVCVRGIVKTSGGSPWLAPEQDSSNKAITSALRTAGFKHDDDVQAVIRFLEPTESPVVGAAVTVGTAPATAPSIIQPAAIMPIMQKHKKYDWNRLNPLQTGNYAEYFVKMECALYGLDVYSAELDNKGIDFVIRKGHDRYYDVQVKSSRGFNYIYFPKDKFELRDNMLAALVFFLPNQAPDLFLIPATAWRTPNQCLVSRDYEEKKSKPEWGLSVAPATYPMIAEYSFERIVERL